ncbi:MAG: riboflavin biosynthesis protein RibF [Flavobacteriales bacterium]|nr:riboflavin biosynthesis protein RibF [Flavobacteriales bacterium]MBT6175173.1 riboflavin biosynthesis protein RibF [Flavobacteriales bacterium]
MKVHLKIEGFYSKKPIVLTIGTFDGVHAGHRAVIEVLKEKANKINGETALLTFSPHPRVVLHPDNHNLKLLNSRKEKEALLENAGLDHLIVVHFDIALSRLTPLDYVRKLLAEGIKPTEIVVGDDHRFGRNREGSFSSLKEMGLMFNFNVTALNAERIREIRVSSTKARDAIIEGQIEHANDLLSHPFPLSGTVVEGEKLGQTIDFPTANLKISDPLKIVPMDGVYVVWARINEGKWMKGMMNIGCRPSVIKIDSGEKTIEVHLIGYKGECYGQAIEVRIVKRLRDEMLFNGLNELKAALSRDRDETLELLKFEVPPLL